MATVINQTLTTNGVPTPPAALTRLNTLYVDGGPATDLGGGAVVVLTKQSTQPDTALTEVLRARSVGRFNVELQDDDEVAVLRLEQAVGASSVPVRLVNEA